jgi:LPXTG-motif cell wall-anchored protein
MSNENITTSLGTSLALLTFIFLKKKKKEGKKRKKRTSPMLYSG